MEKDDEIAGSGNSYTAMFWQYDSRLGRRWNQDPKPNPSISNYATFANNPIMFTDLLGDTTSFYFSNFTMKYNKDKKMNLAVANYVETDEGDNAHYYEHPNASSLPNNKLVNGKYYIPINSNYSISGHDGVGRGTDDKVALNTDEKFFEYFVNKEGLKDWGAFKITFAPINDLDIAYNGWLTRNTTTESGSGTTKNSLFLMGNGVYGNANETGNYYIGYATGYNGSIGLGVLLFNGDLWEMTEDTPQDSDDPHEKRVLTTGYETGASNRKFSDGAKK